MTRRSFGTPRKLPSGRWQARYVGPDGVRRSAPVQFATKGEAARWLALAEAEVARGTWLDPERGKIPLAEYAAQWIEQRPLRPRTVELYRGLLRKHIAPRLGAMTIAAITPTVVRQWHADLRKARVGAPTVAKAYRLIKAVLQTAVDDELIVRNPCQIKGASNEPSPERPVATVEQVFALTAAMPERYRAMILIAAFGSLRWGEIIALRPHNVDFNAGTVRIAGALVELQDGTLVLGPPKSAAGRRTVALPASVLAAISDHIARFVAPGTDGLLFCGPKGAPLRRTNFRSAVRWHETVAAIGLPGFHFHDLRHTGNTLAARFASTRELMARMGHDSTRAAIIYQHATSQRDQELATRLDELIRRAEVHAEGESDNSLAAD